MAEQKKPTSEFSTVLDTLRDQSQSQHNHGFVSNGFCSHPILLVPYLLFRLLLPRWQKQFFLSMLHLHVSVTLKVLITEHILEFHKKIMPIFNFLIFQESALMFGSFLIT